MTISAMNRSHEGIYNNLKVAIKVEDKKQVNLSLDKRQI